MRSLLWKLIGWNLVYFIHLIISLYKVLIFTACYWRVRFYRFWVWKVYNKFYDEFYTYEGIIGFSTGFKAIGREIKNKKGEICHVRDHIHVKFTSKGLDIFTQINKIENKDVRQFIIDRFKGLEIKCSRIDIAKDTELHIVEELIKNLFHGNYSGFRSWNQTGNNKRGLTAYLGGRSSEKFVRIYEKIKNRRMKDIKVIE